MNEIKYIKHPKESILVGMTIRENPDEAFENAIKKGMKKPEEWMYMYSEKGKDYFKNYYTRSYITYKQFSVIDIIKRKIKKIVIERRKLKDE